MPRARRQRKPLPPDTVLSICRLCDNPILAGEYTGRSRYPRFHSSVCRSSAVKLCGRNFSTVRFVFGNSNVGELVSAATGAGPATNTAVHRNYDGPLRRYMRAWRLRQTDPTVELPMHPQKWRRQQLKLAKLGLGAVKSGCQTDPAQSDTPGELAKKA